MNALILGLDAAAQLGNFGYSIGRIEDGRVEISEAGLLEGGAGGIKSVAQIAEQLRLVEHALIAIDAPLGWPAVMGTSLANHEAGQPFHSARSQLFRRRTDDVVKARTGKNPLDVGAEKIAHAAHHALEILGQLRKLSRSSIPLAWYPAEPGIRAIEVYPGATLAGRVNKDIRGYKKRRDLRMMIANELREEIPSLDAYVDSSIDAFDACLCLLAAKDFLEGSCIQPDNDALARKEGWIWVRPKAG